MEEMEGGLRGKEAIGQTLAGDGMAEFKRAET